MRPAMKVPFPVVIEQDEDGVFIAVCPVLQGCHSYGYTIEEAIANIREAIEVHLEARRLVGDPIPQLQTVEVEVP